MIPQLLITLAILSPVLGAPTLTHAQRWGFGFLTSFALGMLGFVAAIALVLLKKWLKSEAFKVCIKFFFALACGSLLGDAFVHILSEAYGSSDLNSYFISLILILALIGFLVLEKIFVKCGVVHQHWVEEDEDGHQHGHSHGHKHGHSKKRVSPEDQNHANELVESKIGRDKPQSENAINQPAISEQINLEHEPNVEGDQEGEQNAENGENEADPSCLSAWKGKGSAGYLNLIGSAIHNIIDGLSIGLAFSTGDSTIYVPITVAIFAHEIPRELGDVAILLKNKFSSWQTICSNGLFNLLAVVGAIIGLSTSTLSEQVKTYIMVFVAGNFIYIASDIWKHLFNGTWRTNAVEALGFAIGVGAMFGIKTLEGEHDDHDHDHDEDGGR